MRQASFSDLDAIHVAGSGPVTSQKAAVLVGSFLALLVSNGVIITMTFGTFLKPVSTAFGLSRGQATGALLLALSTTAIGAPIVGRLVDRFGVRAVLLPAILAFAAMTALVGVLAGGPSSFMLLYALLGLSSAGLAPSAFAKVIVGWFSDRRGLALGCVMAAVGVGAAIAPVLTQYLIAHYGWRGAYEILGVIIAVVALPSVFFAIRERPRVTAAAPEGVPARDIWRSRDFWLMAIAFFLMGLAATGVTAHLVPMLTDRGLTPGVAVRTASVAGLALIAGRIGAGLLLDRMGGRSVTALFLTLMLVGIGLLLLPTTGSAFVPATLVGLGLGAEVDLLAFLLVSRFGMRSFAEGHGALFGLFTVGSGVGSVLMGISFDRAGSYYTGLLILAGAIVVAMVATALMRADRPGVAIR